jgi:hypothetical protein
MNTHCRDDRDLTGGLHALAQRDSLVKRAGKDRARRQQPLASTPASQATRSQVVLASVVLGEFGTWNFNQKCSSFRKPAVSTETETDTTSGLGPQPS